MLLQSSSLNHPTLQEPCMLAWIGAFGCDSWNIGYTSCTSCTQQRGNNTSIVCINTHTSAEWTALLLEKCCYNIIKFTQILSLSLTCIFISVRYVVLWMLLPGALLSLLKVHDVIMTLSSSETLEEKTHSVAWVLFPGLTLTVCVGVSVLLCVEGYLGARERAAANLLCWAV